MTTTLHFLRLLTITSWVGGIIFFAFILAPTAFHTLPSIYLAGLVVGAALRTFDIVALVAGIVFVAATAALAISRRTDIVRRRNESVLVAVMLLATAYLHFSILPAMEVDRANAGGDIDSVAKSNPARVHFDRLHVWSERLEGSVLFAGLGVLLVMASEPARPPSL